MKKLFTLLFCITAMTSMQSQSVIGKWKTIDDVTGEAKSIVEVFSKSGKIYAKVVDILDPATKNNLCKQCSGEDKNKPILGLTIIKGLSKDGSEYNSGEILDPKNGKLYKCALALESKDKLKVRGYIGFSLLGRTQYWHRVN
ncbi:DUF2147 domain-containing protein [Flavobacterium sp.]|uniref:DUF2147 domain-containing protein n=1 Tax=Flavobacterium sp. TaxID=239 RepID=UPI0008C0E6CD|nr:DUF2147 domain-containing protein [Flavobacterium sp.]OGS63804.1 MAG: hypothetical protein A2X21_00345 [Flavobacteria bacterium GWA2_35_26]HCF04136.1 DUF2147 domain-containing protein [Flavobacterium sp.]